MHEGLVDVHAVSAARWALVIGSFVALAALPCRDAFAQAIEPALKGRRDVLFFETFDAADWFKRWGVKTAPQNLQLVAEKPENGRGGGVAKILFRKGENYGSSWSLKISPPLDEAWLRYYVKWDKGFDFDQGGKTPGFMGWAPGRQAGWGGRPVHGDDGFSCRVCWGRRGSLVMYTYTFITITSSSRRSPSAPSARERPMRGRKGASPAGSSRPRPGGRASDGAGRRNGACHG
jgi:hypothetical protein